MCIGISFSDNHGYATSLANIRAIMRIWCLLITSDSWSNPLKDVANEVAAILARCVQSGITTEAELTARRILKSVIGVSALITLDSKSQYMLPAYVRFIGLVVKSLFHQQDTDIPTQVYLTELAFLVVKVAEKIMDR